MGDSLTESRGQKRLEMADELPADKRTCNSHEFTPSSSSMAPCTLVASTSSVVEAREEDMETSPSSPSASGRSEDEEDRDSPYNSDDSEDMNMNDDHRYATLRDYQHNRSSRDSAKFCGLLPSLNNEDDPSIQLVALTELCELLSFTVESSIPSTLANQLAPPLVKLATHENNPDLMLLAVRAITYLCDVSPNSSSIFVTHNAVPALCQRLMIIEYLDVAEQCLQALEKLSRNQPVPCLQSGAILAVLGYIDFFSTTVQRTALRTVVNICKKLPPVCPPPVIEAVPRLCNLLQYEDQQLVELVVSCLITIVDRVKDSPELLSELRNYGLINQATHLINLNSRITLSQPTYTGLIGVITKIASGSLDAVRTLYNLNIGSILKDALSNSDFSNGVVSRTADRNCNQVNEVVKLLHVLLPEVKGVALSSKEEFLLDQSETLQKFGMEIFPTLVQMVNSGANTKACYGCLSTMSRLVYISESESLLEMFKEINIASFLAGVFTQNDHHVLLLALQIAEIVLEKLPNVFIQVFIKEGVFYAIETLLMTHNSSQLTSPMLEGSQSEPRRRVIKCLCYEYRSYSAVSTSKSKGCNLDKESVDNIAERLKTKYFSVELSTSQGAVTDVLQKLRHASAAITDLLSMCANREENTHIEEKLCHILFSVIRQLTGNEPISTFELIESGIVKALLIYLSNGLYLKRDRVSDDTRQMLDVQKRFEAFARVSLSSPDLISSEESSISLFVRRVQSALSNVLNFPVVVGCTTRQRVSYATVPNERNTTWSCLRVNFVRGEEELSLSEYVQGVVTVDPFCKVEEIEQHLISKVCLKKDVSECNPSPEIQGSSKDEVHPLEAETNLIAIASTTISSDDENIKENQNQSSSFSAYDAPSKLVLYLDGEPLEHSSTLYQEILQRRMKSKLDLQNLANLWSTTYTLTYKRVEATETNVRNTLNNSNENSVLNHVHQSQEVIPVFFNIFVNGLGSAVDSSSPMSDILYLLKSLETMTRFANHLLSFERLNAFGNGKLDDLDHLKVVALTMSQYEFVSNSLNEKLQQQLCDPSTMHVGAMPLWCSHLMLNCPFLFSFEAKCKYFELAAFGKPQFLLQISNSDTNVSRERLSSARSVPHKKFLASRDRILESATQMMELCADKNVVIDVEYIDEVGTGLGPTLEFYTLVSRDFQKGELGMWRGDYMSSSKSYSQQGTSLELFPRPWSSKSSNVNGVEFADVIRRFILLGRIVGKALRDGRVFDIPFSKAFYKLILGKELSICDIRTFDPELGRTLLEFKALIRRRRFLEIGSTENVAHSDCFRFRDSNFEDLCLEFTLPGYTDYILPSGKDVDLMVTSNNLAEYVSMVLDATLYSGISRQMEAFKSGLNQVFSDVYLRLFTEEELERLLCGESDSWVSKDLFDHIKFDHGYTASSLPILNLMEVISEFDYDQRRAFLQFVTGAPRLPRGGLAALNPKMTIVRKHPSNLVDEDLPSVMTCANYLKLPPYSSKEKMKEKMLYAISEGQGSFHLS